MFFTPTFTQYWSSPKHLAAVILALTFSINGNSALALKLTSTPPPTIEDASFVVSGKAGESSSWSVIMDKRCTKCPRKLNLTATSSIRQGEDNTSLSAESLKRQHQYHAIYISYDPKSLNVYRILLQ